MPNHVHLAVTTPAPNVSDGMRDLLGGYSRWFNRAHRRSGHLFSAHFRDVPISDDRQLLAVVRYICRNPVRAGLARSPGDWRWSSYAATLAPNPPDAAFVNASTVLGLLASDAERARRAFRHLVDEASPVPELHPSLLAPEGPPDGSVGVPEILRRFGEQEGAGVCVRLGFTQRDVAAELGVTPSAVSHHLTRHRLR